MFKNKKFLFSLLLLVLIVVISACGGSSDDNDNNNNAANNGGDQEATADGQEVYKNQCMSCHGDAGEGASGPPLQGDDFAADFDNVVDQVKNGGGSMPEFGSKLSDDEIDAVATYITEEVANK